MESRGLLSLRRTGMNKRIQGILSMLLCLITTLVSFSVTKDGIRSVGFLPSVTNTSASFIRTFVKSWAIFRKHIILHKIIMDSWKVTQLLGLHEEFQSFFFHFCSIHFFLSLFSWKMIILGKFLKIRLKLHEISLPSISC